MAPVAAERDHDADEALTAERAASREEVEDDGGRRYGLRRAGARSDRDES